MLDEDERFFKEHGTPLWSSHMIDLSEESVQENIETTAKYLKRVAPMKQWYVCILTSLPGCPRHMSNQQPK
jgi:fructose-bisphosphate aldolase class II